MKIIFSIIIFSFSCSVFANKYLDSTETHPYVKLTSFLFPYDFKYSPSGFAIGPSFSISGEHLEFNLSLLYDVKKYEYTTYNHFGPPEQYEYHKFYLPFSINYSFGVSKKIKIFPTIGAGIGKPFENDPYLSTFG